MNVSFIAFVLIANTAFLDLDGQWEELCVVTEGSKSSEVYIGQCKDAVKRAVEDIKKKDENAIINIVINGNELNRI